MGLDLKKRKEKQQSETFPLAVDIGGEVLNIRYRASVLTSGDIRRMKEIVTRAKGEEDPTERTLEYLETKESTLLKQVAEWDLVADGEPVPLTMDALVEYEVDHDLIDLILEAIQKAQNPNPPTGRNSEIG